MWDSGQTAEEEDLVQWERSAYDERAELESDDEDDVEWERMEYVRCNRLPPDHLDGWSSDALKNLDDFLRDNTEICRRMNVERRVLDMGKAPPPGCTTEQRTTAGVPRELDTAEQSTTAAATTERRTTAEVPHHREKDAGKSTARPLLLAAPRGEIDKPRCDATPGWAPPLNHRPVGPPVGPNGTKTVVEPGEQHYQVMLKMQSIPTIRK